MFVNVAFNCTTATVSIQVLDADDNPPEFSNNSFAATVKENSPQGTPLQLNAPMSVTDKDKVNTGHCRQTETC